MSMLETLQAASLEARKARDNVRATLLVTVYSEAARVGKDDGNRVSTDDEVLKTIKKFLTGVEETLMTLYGLVSSADESRENRIAVLNVEKEILASFLPVQITTDELKSFIASQVAVLTDKSPKQMGVLMKQLKEKFGVNYDAKVASELVKDALRA